MVHGTFNIGGQEMALNLPDGLLRLLAEQGGNANAYQIAKAMPRLHRKINASPVRQLAIEGIPQPQVQPAIVEQPVDVAMRAWTWSSSWSRRKW